MYRAHIRKDGENEFVNQSVRSHLEKTAEYCNKNLASMGLANCGYFLGIIHDFGKYTAAFDNYLERSVMGEKPAKVIHTFAGIKMIFALPSDDDPFTALCVQLMAYAVAAHHGAFDIYGSAEVSGFTHRIEYDETSIFYDEAKAAFFAEIADYDRLKELFDRAVVELSVTIKKIVDSKPKNMEMNFYFGMLARLLLSALVDADHTDTAEFMQNRCIHREFDSTLWQDRCAFFEKKITAFTADNDINIARQKISELCKAYGEKKTEINRISRLTVPTGGGKTLSSLRYALSRANADPTKRHVFFVIPLLSVIEQNADVLRQYIGDDNVVLEHHSNVIIRNDQGAQPEYELLAQSWDSPIIITTLVQLLNTLFDSGNSCVRRMNALHDSVIIIDEVQSIPRKLINMFNSTLNFLTRFCGTDVVLCSATQPTFEATTRPLLFENGADMVPFDSEIWSCFKRTEIVNMCRKEKFSNDEVCELAQSIMTECNSLLIICNTKKQVLELYKHLKVLNTDYVLFNLSNFMCLKHRRETLEKINAALENKTRIICVSSQIVEAGVDFSFESVIRAEAGLDNIAQAAGRCNRNGEFDKLCKVYIVNMKDENLRSLMDIKHSQDAMDGFLYRFGVAPERYNENILSDESINEYYRLLFADKSVSSVFNYPCPSINTDIYEMLSLNRRFLPDDSPYILNQAFKTAGECFNVFDDSTTEVIVPYDDNAKSIISGLYSARARNDAEYLRKLIDDSRQFTISLFNYQMNMLEKSNGVHSPNSIPVVTLNEGFYSNEFGLDLSGVLFNAENYLK